MTKERKKERKKDGLTSRGIDREKEHFVFREAGFLKEYKRKKLIHKNRQNDIKRESLERSISDSEC